MPLTEEEKIKLIADAEKARELSDRNMAYLMDQIDSIKMKYAVGLIDQETALKRLDHIQDILDPHRSTIEDLL